MKSKKINIEDYQKKNNNNQMAFYKKSKINKISTNNRKIIYLILIKVENLMIWKNKLKNGKIKQIKLINRLLIYSFNNKKK